MSEAQTPQKFNFTSFLEQIRANFEKAIKRDAYLERLKQYVKEIGASCADTLHFDVKNMQAYCRLEENLSIGELEKYLESVIHFYAIVGRADEELDEVQDRIPECAKETLEKLKKIISFEKAYWNRASKAIVIKIHEEDNARVYMYVFPDSCD